jgi:hypothetical protein
MAPVVEAYQAMRGASFLVAVIFAAEIGDVRRFDTPRQRSFRSSWLRLLARWLRFYGPSDGRSFASSGSLHYTNGHEG